MREIWFIYNKLHWAFQFQLRMNEMRDNTLVMANSPALTMKCRFSADKCAQKMKKKLMKWKKKRIKNKQTENTQQENMFSFLAVVLEFVPIFNILSHTIRWKKIFFVSTTKTNLNANPTMIVSTVINFIYALFVNT